MPYLLDTDTCIYLDRDSLSIEKKTHEVGDENIFISSITVAELYFGAFKSRRQADNMKGLSTFLEDKQILNFTKNTAKIFGRLKSETQQRGKPVADMDLAIAAIAIFHQYTLVTHNTRHFASLRELMIEDWS